jgi:hypothetical protein
LDEEKSKHAGLAQQNGFGLAFFPSLKTPAPPDWLGSMIDPGGLLLINSLPPILAIAEAIDKSQAIFVYLPHMSFTHTQTTTTTPLICHDTFIAHSFNNLASYGRKKGNKMRLHVHGYHNPFPSTN